MKSAMDASMLWGMPMTGFGGKKMKGLPTLDPSMFKVIANLDGNGNPIQQQNKKKQPQQQQKKKKPKGPNDPARAASLNYRGQINRYTQVLKEDCPTPLELTVTPMAEDKTATATAVLQVKGNEVTVTAQAGSKSEAKREACKQMLEHLKSMLPDPTTIKKQKQQQQEKKKKTPKAPTDPARAAALNYRGAINRYTQVMKEDCPTPLQLTVTPITDGTATATAVLQVKGNEVTVTAQAESKAEAKREACKQMLEQLKIMLPDLPASKRGKPKPERGEKRKRSSPTSAGLNNSVQVLNQFAQKNKSNGPEWAEEWEGDMQHMRMAKVTCTMKIKDKQYVGIGVHKAKKYAKRMAALDVIQQAKAVMGIEEIDESGPPHGRRRPMSWDEAAQYGIKADGSPAKKRRRLARGPITTTNEWPDDWTCPGCGEEGCFGNRSNCYKCGADNPGWNAETQGDAEDNKCWTKAERKGKRGPRRQDTSSWINTSF